MEYGFKDVKIMLGGKEIEINPIEYKPKQIKFQFYLRRGNKYFFRNMFDRFAIELPDDEKPPLIYGQEYDITFNVEGSSEAGNFYEIILPKDFNC